MRQVVKYILVIGIASGGYYAARRFDAPPGLSADPAVNEASPLTAFTPGDSDTGGSFAVTALIDSERTFAPVPLPEQRLDVAKQPTIEKLPTDKLTRAPEDEPSVTSTEVSRYIPPNLSEDFPQTQTQGDADKPTKPQPNEPPKPKPAENQKKRANQRDRQAAEAGQPGDGIRMESHAAKPDEPNGGNSEPDETDDSESFEPNTGDREPKAEPRNDDGDVADDEYRARESRSAWDSTGQANAETASIAKRDDRDRPEASSASDRELEDRATPPKKSNRTASSGNSGQDHQPAGTWVATRDDSESISKDGKRLHRVVDGDTLGSLAQRYLGRSDRFLEIFQANADRLYDPRLLPIGLELIIPDANTGFQTSQTSGSDAKAFSDESNDTPARETEASDLQPVPTFVIPRDS